MNEIRCDPLSGYRVLIAEGRSARPRDYETSHVVGSKSNCPFCAGNEKESPEEVLRVSSADDTDLWQVRVVGNKYPALSAPTQSGVDPTSANPTIHSSPASHCSHLPDNEISAVPGEGLHEVIIESPEHYVRTTELGVTQLTAVLQATKKRVEQIRNIPTVRSVHIFKNVGPTGGATIEHTHSQLVALPIIPPALHRELSVMVTHQQRTERCLLCEMQEIEKNTEKRFVAENSNFTAFCAYAGRQPGETWIVPKKHQADFSAMSLSECRSFAEILDRVLSYLDVALQMPAYNYMFQSAPLEGDSIGHYHWRLVILPRVTTQAGFEWSSGCFINPVAPERIAEAMRKEVPVERVSINQTTSYAVR